MKKKERRMREYLLPLTAVVILFFFAYFIGHEAGKDYGMATQECIEELGCDCTPEIVRSYYLPMRRQMLLDYPLCLTIRLESSRKMRSLTVTTPKKVYNISMRINIPFNITRGEWESLRFMTNCSDDAEELEELERYPSDNQSMIVWLMIPKTNETYCMWYNEKEE